MQKPKAEQLRLWALVVVAVIFVVVVLFRLLGSRGGAGGPAEGDRVAYAGHDLPALESSEQQQLAENSAEFQRNPFIYGVRPTPTPRPVTPAPTRPLVRRSPPPTRTPRVFRGDDGSLKPPPPPFDRDFIGHFGPLDLQVAAFRLGGDDPEVSEVQVVKVGDVLDGVFIVREIGFESVIIGFVGYDPSEDTRVPLAEN
jgi:hypothetical protein